VRLLEALGREAGHGERAGKGLDIGLDGLDLLAGLGGDDKVLELLAGLLLDGDGDDGETVQELSDLDKVGLLEAARGKGSSADADTTGGHGADVAVDSVLVDGDAGELGNLLKLAASEGL